MALGSRTIVAAIAVGGVAAIAAFAYPKANQLAGLGSAYKAKMTCSELFVAGHDVEAIEAREFAGLSAGIDQVKTKVDPSTRTVTASLMGLGRATAVHRDDYGCTLVAEGAPAALPDIAPVADAPWPIAAPDRVDADAVEAILRAAIAAPEEKHLAIAAFVDGGFIAEAYADGIDAATPLLSWSMAKSVTAAMVGVAVHKGLIDIDARPPIDDWATADDPRGAITWRDLLQMQSGLSFGEIYGEAGSDATVMLFDARSAAAVAVAKQTIAAPGEVWSYSSGTTNILQHALRLVLEDAGLDYHRFARDELFAPLGAASALLEPDSAGDFIGSSFMYATARDWAKFGQLHLQDGIWNGERLLPEGWVEFVRTPAGQSDKQYGAQFWLNYAGADGRPQFAKGLPEEAYVMAGHEGQYVMIVPDKNMVLVRMGRNRAKPGIDAAAPVFAKVYEATKKPTPAP